MTCSTFHMSLSCPMRSWECCPGPANSWAPLLPQMGACRKQGHVPSFCRNLLHGGWEEGLRQWLICLSSSQSTSAALCLLQPKAGSFWAPNFCTQVASCFCDVEQEFLHKLLVWGLKGVSHESGCWVVWPSDRGYVCVCMHARVHVCPFVCACVCAHILFGGAVRGPRQCSRKVCS